MLCPASVKSLSRKHGDCHFDPKGNHPEESDAKANGNASTWRELKAAARRASRTTGAENEPDPKSGTGRLCDCPRRGCVAVSEVAHSTRPASGVVSSTKSARSLHQEAKRLSALSGRASRVTLETAPSVWPCGSRSDYLVETRRMKLTMTVSGTL